MKITVETKINAPIDRVWDAWSNPTDIRQWNTPSADWHTTRATVDLRVGGAFLSRMEAKDGSAGFDFEGVYTQVVKHERIEYIFGERGAQVEFDAAASGVTIRVTFDAETENSVDQQRQGWQAILDSFASYVEAPRQADVTAR